MKFKICFIHDLCNFNYFTAEIDLIPLGATFFFSLWLGVEYGTLIGIGVDLVLLMLPYAKPKTMVSKTTYC